MTDPQHSSKTSPPGAWRRRLGSWQAALAALVSAGVAIALALVAVVLAGVAVSRAGDAGNRAGTAPPIPPATSPSSSPPSEGPSSALTAPPSAEPSSSESDGYESPTDEPTDISPSASFSAVYVKQALRVQPPPGCTDKPRYVDLDEPRVGADPSRAEFGFTTVCQGPAQIDLFSGTSVSSVLSANATAQDCAESIRNSPINEPLVATRKLNLCITTGSKQAQKQGIPQKIVLVTIASTSGDGTANMLATAWQVPG